MGLKKSFAERLHITQSKAAALLNMNTVDVVRNFVTV